MNPTMTWKEANTIDPEIMVGKPLGTLRRAWGRLTSTSIAHALRAKARITI